MQAGVIPVLVAGDKVVTTATNAIKALFNHDVINNGSYSIELDHCVTVEKKYGVFLDEELLKVCDKKEDAEASLQKVQKAIEVIDNMEFGQPLSFLKLFDHVPMFGDDEDEDSGKEPIRAELQKMNNSNQEEKEFLFEKKHWKILLEKLKPSIRLLVKKYIIFNESVIIVGEEGEEHRQRSLTLDISINDEGSYFLNQDDADRMSRALEKSLIATLLELEVLPKDATDNDGIPLYKQSDKDKDAEVNTEAEEGFVYFIRNKDLFKIGITTDLKRRMDELKPCEILNSVRCKNYTTVERDVHTFFKDSRIPQTEYFRLDESDVASVHRLMMKLADF